jgi:hypothetical protein
MGTTRTFQAMLNEYLSNDLMKEELVKRDWLLSNIEQDNDWKGGNMPVPFQGAQATSVKFGGLTADTDIAEDAYVRGNIASQVEVWGTMLWNHRDILEHDGKVNEKSFLKVTPGKIEDFMSYMKEIVSGNLLRGASFAKVTDSTNAATGVLVVDHIDRFVIGQKAVLDDDNSTQSDVYIIAINLNTNEVTVSATRGGAFLDASAYTFAQNAKFYHDGVMIAGTITNRFTSLKESLLSAANGGTASLYGVSKLSYPYLQAINISGASITSSNILSSLFDAFTTVRSKARGTANKIVMSYKHLGSIMKLIETQKGGFKQVNETRANIYGWTEIDITSVKGTLTVVGVQEMDDSEIMLLDMSAMKFITNGFFKKRTSPDGKMYFEKRGTTGYQYLVDVSLFGEFMLTAPSKCGIIYGISY